MKRFILLVCLLPFGFFCLAQPVRPYGAIPSPSQLAWEDLDMYMFTHFGPNTFTDREWGTGKENPDVFDPSALDCRQWARTALLAGMKGIIITAKHHDGFCLWPSHWSTHTVAQSNWEGGHGDVLRELSSACREFGLKFGVYLSPWDRNHPAYGTPAYNQVFAGMLREIYRNYGPVFEQWFDGANGEGPHGKKQIYDWTLFDSTVLTLQPDCVIFSDVGPGARWVGDENGIAGRTNWSTLNRGNFTPGAGAPPNHSLRHGDRGGIDWVPAECDVSIRPGWFYSPSTDEKQKSLSQLARIYLNSVGRNANLILNVPPDRTGRIAVEDSIRLMQFRAWISRSFSRDLALGARVTASDTRGNHREFAPANLVDGSDQTYWATDDGDTSASLVLLFPDSIRFNCLELREFIALGQRVESFTMEVWKGGHYEEVTRGTTIGHERILVFPTQKTRRVRLSILASLACPVISEIRLFRIQDPGGLIPDNPNNSIP